MRTCVCVCMRAQPMQIFTGKENHLDLIKEMRTAHALRAEEQQMQKADKEMVMALKEERDKLRLKVLPQKIK